jgi:hypothetical protein
MKTIKDKKKFGYNKQTKNRTARKGYQFDKEQRKCRRKILKLIKHKIKFKIPFSEDEQNIIKLQLF